MKSLTKLVICYIPEKHFKGLTIDFLYAQVLYIRCTPGVDVCLWVEDKIRQPGSGTWERPHQ